MVIIGRQSEPNSPIILQPPNNAINQFPLFDLHQPADGTIRSPPPRPPAPIVPAAHMMNEKPKVQHDKFLSELDVRNLALYELFDDLDKLGKLNNNV